MDVTSKTYKIIIGIIELFLGVPFIGGIFIVAHAWMPLVILFVLHIVGIIIAGREYKSRTGHILGVIGNALGWIPVLGWIFHLAIGVILLAEGLSNR